MEPEETRNYEIGTKWEFFDAVLGVNLALFRTETKNARTIGPDSLPVFVGERRIDGVEVSVNGQVLPGWSVFGGYTYMDSEVKFAGENNVANGKPFPNTPKHSFTLWSTYDFADRYQVGGGAIYNAKQYGNFGADGVSRSIPSYPTSRWNPSFPTSSSRRTNRSCPRIPNCRTRHCDATSQLQRRPRHWPIRGRPPPRRATISCSANST